MPSAAPTARATNATHPSLPAASPPSAVDDWLPISLPPEWADDAAAGYGVAPTLNGVVAAGPGFVAGGSDGFGGQVWVSGDGVTWDRLTHEPHWDGARIAAMTVWDGRILAAGTYWGEHLAFWVSDDGYAWEALPDAAELHPTTGPDALYPAWDVHSLSANEEGIMVVVSVGCEGDCGPRYVTLTSRDGSTWSSSGMASSYSLPPRPLPDGRGWMRVTEGETEVSSDGTDWQSMQLGRWARSVEPVAGGFVAVTGLWLGDNLRRSTDGVTWTPAGGLDLSDDDYISDVASISDRVLAVGLWHGAPTAWLSPPPDAPPPNPERPTEPPGGLKTADGTWYDESPLGIGLPEGAAVALPDGRLAALGGSIDYEPAATAGIYDPADGEWTDLPPMPEALTRAAAVALTDGTILVFGQRTYALPPGADEWQTRASPPRSYELLGCLDWEMTYPSTVGSAVVGADGLVYVAGVCGAYDDGGTRVDVYNPRRDRWLDPIRLPVPTTASVVAVRGDDIAIVTRARVWFYSTSDKSLVPGPTLLRGGYGVAGVLTLPDDRLVLLRPGSAWTDGHLAVEVLGSDATTWFDAPSPGSMWGFSAAAAGDGRIYLLGGVDDEQSVRSLVLDP